MKKYRYYLASAYLVFCLHFFCGLTLSDWELWVSLVPVIVMFTIEFVNGFGGKRK